MTQENAVEKTAGLRERAIAALTAGRMDEGIGLLSNALSRDPQSAALHADLGTARWQNGELDQAESHYKEAMRLEPKNPFILNAYGAFLLERRRLDEAEKLLKQALALKPAHHEIQNNMGLLHYRRGKLKEAEPFFARALKLAPNWPVPHANLANVLRDTKRYALAERGYRHAIGLNPENGAAWSDLGRLYFLVRRENDAAECLRRAVKHAPADDTAWVRLLDVLERLNKTDEAKQALAEAKRHFRDNPGIILQEAKLLRREGRAEEAVALMEKCSGWLKKSVAPSTPFFIEFFYELGQLYDRAEQPEKAIACLKAAKGGQSAATSGAVISGETIARLKEGFVKPNANAPALEGRESPVFLVGFPRSGTTLLSQILASHPDIYASEETAAVDNMARVLEGKTSAAPKGWWSDKNYPASLADVTDEDIAAMRERFFALHDAQGAKQKRVLVDKLPLNLLHAPLIRRVFPEAKFILALRHPCDSVLSCYMQRFELNPAMARFLDLKDAARFYDEAFGLWNFYAERMSLPVHAVKYEDVVGDFRPTVEGLLQFLGAAWDDAVLEHDKTAQNKEQRILTPSYRQVADKIYTSAQGRWLRYGAQMEPLLGILKPHAEKFGYAMEDAEAA